MNLKTIIPSSSISKKVVMALTGLALFGFLISHLAGNFLMFAGPKVYNQYSHTLISNPLIYGAEAFLLLVFVYHMVTALMVSYGNLKARPIGYKTQKSLGKSTLSSSTMAITGGIILIFLIVHLYSFKFGTDVAPPSADGVRDLYALVVSRFGNPLYSGFYILCMASLGFHLSHALQSSFRTLGVSHPKYLSAIEFCSVSLGITFAILFSVFPIYFGFIK